MQFVISVCMTLSLAWIAVFVTVKGLQTSVEAATEVQTSHLNEYRAHFCGSVRAAIANLEAAGELLQSIDGKRAPEYMQASDIYLYPLVETLTSGAFPLGDLNCAEIKTTLHNQAVGETPHNLPNFVYRLSHQRGGTPDD